MSPELLKQTKRILVVGCSGSGKSTLTRHLENIFDLPAIHMDIHFWNSGWVETPANVWREKVEGLVDQPRWIMDGTFANSFDLRMPRAEAIVILDFPPLLCLWRAFFRVLKYKKSDHRPDMAEGCHERMDWEFYKYILTYRRIVYPKILSALNEYRCEEKAIFLKGQRQVDQFLKQLENIYG
ncbi:MAG: hypothetical protein KDD61_09795 [Bdellovibrionales bacterium]|nr:hypothetical protein [Bdellovibrionales bacterium]